jgi:hypothetical protein
MQQRFEFDTDHFQFFIGDHARGPRTNTEHIWDTSDSVATLRNIPFLVGVATARYGSKTRVVVEIVDKKPSTPDGEWKEMGSFSLQAPSGKLILWAPENVNLSGLPTVTVQPGNYDGLVFSTGTDTVIDEMAPDGPDEYRIVLWRLGE